MLILFYSLVVQCPPTLRSSHSDAITSEVNKLISDMDEGQLYCMLEHSCGIKVFKSKKQTLVVVAMLASMYKIIYRRIWGWGSRGGPASVRYL